MKFPQSAKLMPSPESEGMLCACKFVGALRFAGPGAFPVYCA